MGIVPTDLLPELRRPQTTDVGATIANPSGLHSPRIVQQDASAATNPVLERVNNSLQALVNLFYLIARESRLDPQLQPLVTQVQAELAQLSCWIRKLG